MRNKQSGFTLVELIIAIVILATLLPWPINFYRLTQCDFNVPLKCEIIHGFGVIVPPASIVTVWFDTDESKEK